LRRAGQTDSGVAGGGRVNALFDQTSDQTPHQTPPQTPQQAPYQTPDLLAAIVAATRRIVAERRVREPEAAVARRAGARAPRGSLFESRVAGPDWVNIIAECKRRSPSKGVLAPSYDPVAIARAYQAGGAAAISVLTEPAFFDGSLEHLAAVRAAVDVPLLRKDFIVDEYQLLEACANGADAVLLIVAALEQPTLERLQTRAWDLGLATLVEVHDDEELARALDSGARIVGVNNRNLRTLQVDVAASDRLAAKMPTDVVAVSESGLQSRADLERLSAAGYGAFLIGERFMTDPDPASALRALMQARPTPNHTVGRAGRGV
jgi:indole-3-glycerol phosphate synthase